MSMKKRILLIISVFLLAALAGCASKTPETGIDEPGESAISDAPHTADAKADIAARPERDKPAEYDEWSTWRVDMGDEPGVFEPLFLARLDDRLVMALTWGAPEGELLVVLREENGRLVGTDEYYYSRYWAPS